jgi:hypothetical protein
MSPEQLSRRAIVAGVAVSAVAAPVIAGPALAAIKPPTLPVVAPPLPIAAEVANLAATEPDPIFAALAEHRRLKREWASLLSEFDEAETAKGNAPIPLITWRNYCIGGREIERVRDEFLAQPGAHPKQIQLEYRKAKADERAKKRAEREWHKRNDLADLQGKCDDASDTERVAFWELTKVRPTTVKGAGALIAFVREDMKAGDDPWQIAALANAARALLQMPNEALPFDPVSKDLDLVNAIYHMHNADSEIDRIHEKHGDDACDRDDYQQCEEDRVVAIDLTWVSWTKLCERMSLERS